jgi:antitoxin (DNA-binding transcriptional repressor) of toxin-antitoxin stability system
MTGRILQSGTHIARIVALKQPDDTYEAQVFVRLTREPEIAETYIPAGTFETEQQAWEAAEMRAKRALEEHEF